MRRFIDHIRHHRHRRWILTGAATSVALAGGITFGALTAGSTSVSATPAAAAFTSSASAGATTTTVPGAAKPAVKGKGHHRERRMVRGQIKAINGETWTVDTFSGRTVTVTITSSTKFGKKAKATPPVVGTDVRVLGARTGKGSITALRVGLAKDHRASGSAPSGPTGSAA